VTSVRVKRRRGLHTSPLRSPARVEDEDGRADDDREEEEGYQTSRKIDQPRLSPKLCAPATELKRSENRFLRLRYRSVSVRKIFKRARVPARTAVAAGHGPETFNKTPNARHQPPAHICGRHPILRMASMLMRVGCMPLLARPRPKPFYHLYQPQIFS
jgi:hypothetical protein